MIDEHSKAIILKRTNYGEADRILSVITPNGRRSVIAKSSRKEKSKLAGSIELMCVDDFVVHYRKTDEMGILVSSRIIKFYKNLTTDYDKLSIAYNFLKLVDSATSSADAGDWFNVLNESFNCLDAGLDEVVVQIWFYLRFAALCGYELSLIYDINGNKLREDSNYYYDTINKGLCELVNGDITSDHIKFLRIMSSNNINIINKLKGFGLIKNECFYIARAHAGI
jgi:DNA repair protein RecO (recombination protein O)